MVNANPNVYVREIKARGDAIIQVKTLLAQSIKAKCIIENFNLYGSIRREYFIVVIAFGLVQALLHGWGHWRTRMFICSRVQWLINIYWPPPFTKCWGTAEHCSFPHELAPLIRLWALFSLSLKWTLASMMRLSRMTPVQPMFVGHWLTTWKGLEQVLSMFNLELWLFSKINISTTPLHFTFFSFAK